MWVEVVNGSAGPGASVGSRRGKARLLSSTCAVGQREPRPRPLPLYSPCPPFRGRPLVLATCASSTSPPPLASRAPSLRTTPSPFPPLSGPAPGCLASRDCQRDAGGPLGRHSRRVEPPGPPAHSYRGCCTLGGGARAKYPYGLGCAEDKPGPNRPPHTTSHPAPPMTSPRNSWRLHPQHPVGRL